MMLKKAIRAALVLAALIGAVALSGAPSVRAECVATPGGIVCTK